MNKLNLKWIAVRKYGSVKNFGEQLGIKKSHASHILNGTRPLKDIYCIARVSDALDIPLDILEDYYNQKTYENKSFVEKIIIKIKKWKQRLLS